MALNLPKMCVMVLTIMFQDHNLEAKSQNSELAKSRENLRQEIFGKSVFGEI